MSAAGDALIAKLRCALAEEGYGDALMEEEYRPDGGPGITFVTDIPTEVLWKAWRLADAGPCWSCFFTNSKDAPRHHACGDGDCQAGPTTPRVPPRRVSAANTKEQRNG